MMELINIKDLALGYDRVSVMKDVNFQVNSEDYLCILGENGVGKSTLIKGILGLMKPLKGEIIVSNQIRQTQIGYLPQMTTAQKNFPASVYEVILSGCLNSRGINPLYSKKDKELVNVNMKKLGIEKLKNKCFKDLSGGQQKKVLLARSLCATKKILIMDEPTSGLDPKSTDELYKTICELNKNDHITIIMVSHDIANSLKYATKILHLNNEKTFFGTKDEYRKSKHIMNLIGGYTDDSSNN